MNKIIDPHVRGTVQKIDQKIAGCQHCARLRRLKEEIIQELSSPEESGTGTELPPIRKPPEVTKTSKDTIAEYIVAHGPTQRKDIVAGTGLKLGTVSFALNDKKRFRTVDGKWDLVESLKTNK